MGDYKLHSKETGIGLCNSFEDALKFNVNSFKDLICIESQERRYGGEIGARYDAT
jgi:hypothetical protein